MDRAPPPPRNAYLITVAVRRYLNAAWYFAPPPPPFPPKPSGVFQPFDGVANGAPTTACMDGDGLVGREAGAGLFVGEPEGQLTPYQLVNCCHSPSGDAVSTQGIQHQRNL